MQDLQYTGDEPTWQKKDFFEKYIKNTARPGQSEEDKAWEDIQRHKKSRDLLSVKLEKAQLMLRHSVEIDKQNMEELQECIKMDKKDIEKNEKQMEHYRTLYQNNLERIKNLKAAIGKQDGTDMARGIDDGMSEFSVMTDDSEVLPLENILDLKIDEIELAPSPINGILGMEKPLDSAVQTFSTIEFFNHATKHTDLAQGYNP